MLSDETEAMKVRWRDSSLRQLEDKLTTEVSKAREADEREANEEKKRREQAIKAQEEEQGLRWQLGLALDIGAAVMTAVPNPATPVADCLVWARQAIRVLRYLQKILFRVPEVLAAQTHIMSKRINEALRSIRVSAPRSTRQWAADKEPYQIIKRLERMEREVTLQEQWDESLNQRMQLLEDIKKTSDEEPAETAEQAGSTERKEPTERKESTEQTESADQGSKKSLDELLQDLESINPPAEEPGEESSSNALAKSLKKLQKLEVPLQVSRTKLPVAAEVVSRKSISELAHELRRAARTPHHFSDYAFRQLIDDAEYYLPEEDDVAPGSLLARVMELAAEGVPPLDPAHRVHRGGIGTYRSRTRRIGTRRRRLRGAMCRDAKDSQEGVCRATMKCLFTE